MGMAIVILGALAAVIVLWAIISFNRFVAQRQVIENSWSNVETELTRRHDLIPNLVETVRGYAAHESDTLREVIEARTGAVGAVGGRADARTTTVDERATATRTARDAARRNDAMMAERERRDGRTRV